MLRRVRSRPWARHLHRLRDRVRFVLDVHRDPDGRLEGEISPQGESPQPFSGTLDLLRVLEDHTTADPSVESPADQRSGV